MTWLEKSESSLHVQIIKYEGYYKLIAAMTYGSLEDTYNRHV